MPNSARIFWRSSDGITLDKVFETDPSPQKINPHREFSIIDDTLMMSIKGGPQGIIMMSRDGTNWEEYFSTDEYRYLNDIIEYDGTYYMGASSQNDGGALYSSVDGENWSMIRNWTDGSANWHNTVGEMVIFENELYLALNGNKDDTWVEILKTVDGENFTEVWHGNEDEYNGPEFAVYKDRLYLTMSGNSSTDEGGEIRVLIGDDFELLLDGDGSTEHNFHGRAIFNDDLYIGGGSGKWDREDAVLYRIMDPCPFITCAVGAGLEPDGGSGQGATYRPGDMVEVFSTSSISTDVILEVIDPKGGSRTLAPEDAGGVKNGTHLFLFQIEEDDPIGLWTVYASNDRYDIKEKATFQVIADPPFLTDPDISIYSFITSSVTFVDSTISVRFEIENSHDTPIDILLIVQMKDPDMRPLKPVTYTETIQGNSIQPVQMQVTLPPSSPVGTYFLQGQMHLDYPSLEGHVLDFRTTSVVVV